MGGLGPSQNGIQDIENFLRSIYENIESGKWDNTDPDDFFEVACWHPYIFKEEPGKENWVHPNQKVHEVVTKNDRENKTVVFSEMGYTDNDLSRDKIAEYLKEVFRLAKNNFPWLETIYWYRLSDRNLIYAGGPSKIDGFGVVESPETWTWKPAAYAYQSLTHLDDSAAGVSIPYIGLAVLLTMIVRAQKKLRLSLKQVIKEPTR